MKTEKLHNPDGFERRYRVELSKDEFEELIDKKVGDLAKTAKHRGFRPGKVPHHVLKSSFRTSLEQDVRHEFFQDEIKKMTETDLPVATPLVDFKSEGLDDNSGFVFEVRYETKPSIPEIDFHERIKIPRPQVTDIDELIEHEFQIWIRKESELLDVPDHHVSAKYDIVNWEYLKLEEVGGAPKEGNKTIKMQTIADPQAPEDTIEYLSCGVTVGKVIELDHLRRAVIPTFRSDHSVISLDPVRLTVVSIKRCNIEHPTDEYAHKLGYESLDDMKKSSARAVKNYLGGLVARAARIRLLKDLSDKLEFELPPVLLFKTINSDYEFRLGHEEQKTGKVPHISEEIERLSSISGQEHVLIYDSESDQDSTADSNEKKSSADLLQLSNNDPRLRDIYEEVKESVTQGLRRKMIVEEMAKNLALDTKIISEDFAEWVDEQTGDYLKKFQLINRLNQDENYRDRVEGFLHYKKVIDGMLELLASYTEDQMSARELQQFIDASPDF